MDGSGGLGLGMMEFLLADVLREFNSKRTETVGVIKNEIYYARNGLIEEEVLTFKTISTSILKKK